MVKRFPDIDANARLDAAAHAMLNAFLDDVESHSQSIVSRDDVEEKDIHQWRITSRRFEAAIEAFRVLCRRAPRKWLKRSLKDVRQRAGKVRDLDVMLQTLGDRWPASDIPSRREEFVARLVRDRLRKAKDLQCALRELDQHHHWATIREWISTNPAKSSLWKVSSARPAEDRAEDRADDPSADRGKDREAEADAIESGSLIDLASNELSRSLADFMRARRNAVGGSLEQYHRTRIAGKRLRYLMDLFSECFDDELGEELYRRLRSGLDLLGRVNDERMFRDRVRRFRKKHAANEGDSLQEMERASKLRGRAERDQFEEHWSQSLGEGFERRLLELIHRSPAEARSRPLRAKSRERA